MDIIPEFRHRHNSIADFEQQNNIHLPEDIKAMLGQ